MCDDDVSKLETDADDNVMCCTTDDSLNVPLALVSDADATNNSSIDRSESELVMAAWALKLPALETDVTI